MPDVCLLSRQWTTECIVARLGWQIIVCYPLVHHPECKFNDMTDPLPNPDSISVGVCPEEVSFDGSSSTGGWISI